MGVSQKEYTSYRKDLNKIKNRDKSISNVFLDYDEAEEIIVEFLAENKKELVDSNEGEIDLSRNLTKEDLRREKNSCRKLVTDCIRQKNFGIRKYTGNKLNEFINEMVSEYSGYSILEDAFEDPDVNDIYCIEWNKIYIERNGKNIKYPKTFRSKAHYKDVIERFLRKSGKEINIGDAKIVDFELYGDRGCATSPAVTPRDYTMTLRKHREDHIDLDDLLQQKVINKEISDFFGLIIDGEANIIYAGITGTGKTTTIRAFLDYYVTKNGKRMLVCEDTQELFPKNEHTMEMVSCRSDDPKSDISLYKLIVTALRLKPKYIVVGEVRAEEAQAAIEGMETGHSTILTMHAGEPINAINRLVTKYLMMMPSLGVDIVERIIGSAIDFIAIQDHIPDIGRKVSFITEVVFNDITQRVELHDLLTFDFEKEDWIWHRRIDKNKCRNLMRRGVTKDRVRPWMKTEDEETEKEALRVLNETYYNEKEDRQKIYDKKHQEKLELQRQERLNKKESAISTEEKLLFASEEAKQKEFEDMKLKMERVMKFDSQN